jgi:hypothetical protein
MAHTAWVRGCRNGEGKACAALVEYDLAQSPAERAWATRRAVFLYDPARSKAEVATEQDAAQEQANDITAQYQRGLAEAAARDAENAARTMSALSTAVQNTPNLVQTPYTPPPHVTTPVDKGGHPTAQQIHAEQLQRDAAFNQQQAQQSQSAEQKRKANLAMCLATDQSCPSGSYGTSANCVPSVAYTDRFGGRGSVRAAHLEAQMYTGADMGQAWTAEANNKIAPLLDQAGLQPMVAIMNQFIPRANALSSAVLVGFPTCSAPESSTDQLRFWCANRRADCLSKTAASEQEIDCARQKDQFLYYAEAKQHGIDIQKKHDADCHQQFGN